MDILNTSVHLIKADNQLQRELMRKYKEVVGKVRFLDGCVKCIRETIEEIKKYQKMANCDYKFKDNALVYWGKKSMHLSNVNLTNELAEEFIADNVKHKAFFVVMPEPAKKVVEVKVEEVVDVMENKIVSKKQSKKRK